MPKRCVGSTLLLLLMAAFARAEVRTWTDRQGKTTKAEFVRVHEGRVILKSGTQTLQVPLSGLSQQDQDYVAGQLNRKSARGNDGEGDGQPVRFWTDIRGNQIAASFVRMNETQVMLSESGRLRPIDFAELSPPDREHIKQLLREQGQESLIDALDRHVDEIAKAAAARAAASQPAAAPAAPAESPFERMRQEREQRAEQQRQQEEQRRQAFEQQQAADRERRQQQAEEAKQRQAEQQQRWQQLAQEQQQRSQEQMQQMQERMASLSANSMGPTMVTEYRCSKCNKVVPDNIGAGGHCPHCGVYFEYTQSPTGQRQYAPAGSFDWSNVRLSGRAIKGVVFLVVLICSGAAALWRKFAA